MEDVYMINNRDNMTSSSKIEYYFMKEDKMYGPYTLDDFPLYQINKNTLVWKTGLSEWKTAENFSELNISPPSIKQVHTNRTEAINLANNNNGINRNKTNDNSQEQCWFCEDKNSKKYVVTLNKYKKHWGELGGGTKYSRSVGIYMCKKCAKAFVKQQKVKRQVYLAILFIEIIACSIYVLFEPSCSTMSSIERIFLGGFGGFVFGIFPAWGITELMTNNPKIGKDKLRHSIKEHPEIIVAIKEGYRINQF